MFPRGVTFDDLDIFANGFDVEVIAATGWEEGIEERDRRSEFDETYRQIAADEAQSAGN